MKYSRKKEIHEHIIEINNIEDVIKLQRFFKNYNYYLLDNNEKEEFLSTDYDLLLKPTYEEDYIGIGKYEEYNISYLIEKDNCKHLKMPILSVDKFLRRYKMEDLKN